LQHYIKALCSFTKSLIIEKSSKIKSKNFTWVSGTPNGFTYPDYESITLLDQNNEVFLTATIYPNDILSIHADNDLIKTYSTKINGTMIEIEERTLLNYKRE